MRRRGAIGSVCLIGVLVAVASGASGVGAATIRPAPAAFTPAAFTPAAVSLASGSQSAAETLYTIPVTVSGLLDVQFQGNPGGTCATAGQCSYSGTVNWTPATSGELTVAAVRSGGRVVYEGDLLFSNSPSQGAATGGTTSAQVAWTTGPGLAPQTCSDQQTPVFDVRLAEAADQFQFSLAQAQPDLIQTRCAGPTIADVAAALNPPELPISALLRGNTTVDLSATGNFAAHGLTGNASSTIVLTLGKPQVTSVSLTGNGHGKLVERRTVSVNYRAELSGTVTERITADTSTTTCGPLGACGQSGQLTFQYTGASGPANLIASGPASVPLSDYLSAVGQRPGSMHKLSVIGEVSLQGGATLTSAVSEGGSSCADTVSVDQSAALIARSGNRVGIGLLIGGSDGAAGRTRCPGPILPALHALAGAVVPVSEFRRHVVKVVLEQSVSFADSGYTVELIPNLTLRLTRTGVTVKTYKILASLLGSG